MSLSLVWNGIRQIGAAALTLSVLLLVGFDQDTTRAGHPALHMWQLPPAPPAETGFHNIGLAQFAQDSPDTGHFAHIAVRVLKGTLKTPTNH